MSFFQTSKKNPSEDLSSYTRSELSEALITLDGKPFSLDNYPFYRKIYDGRWPQKLLKCARQVAKSTTGANTIITNSVAMPFFKTLYIAPTQKQTSLFSNSRLQMSISHSPLIRDNFTSRHIPMNVWAKRFANGSEVNLSYATDDPDRVRGASADEIIYDEAQDIVYEAVIPVVNETLSASKYQWLTYMGTPKSMENTMEVLWGQSSQEEWLMKCTGCSKYNYVDSADSLGKTSLICVKCGKALDPRTGFWHAMNPGAEIHGFHISQPIMPENVAVPERWARLLFKYQTYPEHRFKNEVLGISDAVGTRLLSKDDLFALCRNYPISWNPTPAIFDHVLWTVAGVDWSGGGSSTFTSRTVVHIWGMMPDGRLKTMFYKIFGTTNASQDVRDVAEVCNLYKCKLVVGDAGVGAVANSMLIEILGKHRVAQVQYGALSQMIRWNGKDRYMVDKTAAIDTVMMLYKKEGVIFCNAKQMEAAIDDILAEYEEVTQYGAGRKIWTHSPLTPDDSLHAQVFGWLASEIVSHKIQFYPVGDGV